MGQSNGYVLPYDIPANEYLTLEGEKISTSRDWAIWVEDFVKDFDGELLRFVLAANAPESKDADFSWKEFQGLVNNSLANVLGNLANRVFSFTNKNFGGVLTNTPPCEDESLVSPSCGGGRGREIINLATTTCKDIHTSYSEFKVRKVVKIIIDLAREGNKYFDEEKPWVVVKENPAEAEKTLFACAELLRIITIVFYPIMPESMKRLRKMMSMDMDIQWDDVYKTPDKIVIGDFEPLFRKIEDKEIEQQINRLFEKSKK
jgi:methionyl-tRNA synthetase